VRVASTLITSLDNPLVKHVRALHDAAGRSGRREFVVEGKRAIEAFFAAGWKPTLLVLRQGETPFETGGDAVMVTERVAAKLSQATTPSGYLATFALPEHPMLDPAAGGLILHEIGDPGNTGTLVRSAVAFGCAQVVVSGGADPYAHKAVQATAGTLARVRLLRDRFTAARERLRGGAPFTALVVSGGTAPLAPGRRWLVVGSEAHGLPGEVVAACEERVSLPMMKGVESLNAAVAGSIACFLMGRPD
jgi:RNA methyltransferase, TrmH family